MKYRIIVSLSVFFLLSSPAFAQDVQQDTVVTRERYKRPVLVPGFRVQAYAGASRQQAMNIRNEIAEKFPDYAAYVVYKQPTFRVRVGDFKSRGEAQKLLRELKELYSSSFIVPDDINPNPVLPPKPEEPVDESTQPKNP